VKYVIGIFMGILITLMCIVGLDYYYDIFDRDKISNDLKTKDKSVEDLEEKVLDIEYEIKRKDAIIKKKEDKITSLNKYIAKEKKKSDDKLDKSSQKKLLFSKKLNRLEKELAISKQTIKDLSNKNKSLKEFIDENYSLKIEINKLNIYIQELENKIQELKKQFLIDTKSYSKKIFHTSKPHREGLRYLRKSEQILFAQKLKEALGSLKDNQHIEIVSSSNSIKWNPKIDVNIWLAMMRSIQFSKYFDSLSENDMSKFKFSYEKYNEELTIKIYIVTI